MTIGAGGFMPTLVVTLDGNREVRIPDVARATEENNEVVAFDDRNHTKSRFKLKDIRSWQVDADVDR
jgi:hypothetical protein